MRLTKEQQDLMNRCGVACAEAGATIQTAQRSVELVTRELNELIGSLEDPGERMSWASIRNAWLEVAVLLQDATAKFEKG